MKINNWNAVVWWTRVNSPSFFKRERERDRENVRKYPKNSQSCKFQRSVKNDLTTYRARRVLNRFFNTKTGLWL